MNNRRWTNIRMLFEDYHTGRSLIEHLKQKFPNIKFRLGKVRIDPDPNNYNTHPVLLIPIQAYLPTPHPNKESLDREIKWTNKS